MGQLDGSKSVYRFSGCSSICFVLDVFKRIALRLPSATIPRLKRIELTRLQSTATAFSEMKTAVFSCAGNLNATISVAVTPL